MAWQIKNPKHPEARSGPRILLIRLSAVGDVIHAMPCATALRRAQPDAHIAWVCEPWPAQLLSRHPDLDEVISMPRRQWAKRGLLKSRAERRDWAAHLRMRQFDIAIDLQGLWKSAHVARLSNASQRFCFGDDQAREFSWFGVPRSNRVVPPPEARHVVERYLSLLQPLGVRDLDPIWRFGPLPPPERQWVSDWWRGQAGFDDRPWIALNPGAGWETKVWPVTHFAELARRIESELGARAMFLWGPADADLRSQLDGLADAGRFTHAPDNDLTQLRALLTGCAGFVGGDTGPTHLAAALGIPTVSPHGGSDPIRNGPYGADQISLSVTRDEVPCVPCWRTVCNHTERLACMKNLSVDRVFLAVASQLENHPDRAKPPAALLAALGDEGEAPTAEPMKLHKTPAE